jgi:hypothetical protein
MGRVKGKFKRSGGKTGGRDFPPGVSGNPAGRPKAPLDQKLAMQKVRAMQSEMRFDWQHYYRELSALPQEQLQRLVGGRTPDGEVIPSSEPDAPVLKLLVARSILYAMRSGKAVEVGAHRDMMCGPEPKQVELSGPGGEPLGQLSGYTQEKLAAAFATLDRIVQESECKSTQQPQPSESSPPSLPPASGSAS